MVDFGKISSECGVTVLPILARNSVTDVLVTDVFLSHMIANIRMGFFMKKDNLRL